MKERHNVVVSVSVCLCVPLCDSWERLEHIHLCAEPQFGSASCVCVCVCARAYMCLFRVHCFAVCVSVGASYLKV